MAIVGAVIDSEISYLAEEGGALWKMLIWQYHMTESSFIHSVFITTSSEQPLSCQQDFQSRLQCNNDSERGSLHTHIVAYAVTQHS